MKLAIFDLISANSKVRLERQLPRGVRPDYALAYLMHTRLVEIRKSKRNVAA